MDDILIAHAKRLFEEAPDLFPGDIAAECVDKAVAEGLISIDDESAKEITFTEAFNYAERHFSTEGWET